MKNPLWSITLQVELRVSQWLLNFGIVGGILRGGFSRNEMPKLKARFEIDSSTKTEFYRAATVCKTSEEFSMRTNYCILLLYCEEFPAASCRTWLGGFVAIYGRSQVVEDGLVTMLPVPEVDVGFWLQFHELELGSREGSQGGPSLSRMQSKAMGMDRDSDVLWRHLIFLRVNASPIRSKLTFANFQNFSSTDERRTQKCICVIFIKSNGSCPTRAHHFGSGTSQNN